MLGIPHCADGLTLEDSRSYTHPDDVPKLAASAAQALLTDVPVDVETRHRRSDGVWRHMLVRRVVERNAAGEAVAFVGVSLDVTERHQAATALHAASARAALIARSAGIGTWETTLDDGQAHGDAQMYRLHGLEPRLGAMSHDERVALVHADDRRYFLDPRSGHHDAPRLAAYEFRVCLPNGSYR